MRGGALGSEKEEESRKRRMLRGSKVCCWREAKRVCDLCALGGVGGREAEGNCGRVGITHSC